MRYVPHEGPDDASVVWVGEAPGREETLKGRPFIGYTGSVLREATLSRGISIDNCLITNVCHFQPPNNKIEAFIKKRKKRLEPNDLVLDGIFELYELLAKHPRNLIVPLGNIALWALTGQASILKRRKSILRVSPSQKLLSYVFEKRGPEGLTRLATAVAKIQGTKVIPTMHPSAVVRSKSWTLLPLFLTDIRFIVAESQTPDIRLPERSFYIDPEESVSWELALQLREAEDLAFDIEVTGKNLFCTGFSCSPEWALSLRDDEPWKREVVQHILSGNQRKIAQNGLFDVWFLKVFSHIGVKPQNPNWAYDYDTMISQRIIYPDWKVGLDFQTSLYTREPYYKDEGKNWSASQTADVRRFMEYNAKDCCVTLESCHAQERVELLKNPAYRRTFEEKMDITPLALDAMIRGIPLDTVKMAAHDVEAWKNANEATEEATNLVVQNCAAKGSAKALELLKSIAKDGFNPASPAQVAKYVYDVMGFRARRQRKKGKDSRTTKEDTLKQIYGETGDKALLLIIKTRKERKRSQAYTSPRDKKGNPRWHSNGRSFGAPSICRTKSYRWAVNKTIFGEGFNWLSLPPRIRDTVLADRGMLLAYIDLSQAEDRIVAHYANVARKIKAFHDGTDVHSLTGSLIFGLEYEEVRRRHKKRVQEEGKEGPERYLGKQSNHAFNYDEKEETFFKRINMKADETGITINFKTAAAVRKGHMLAYPEIEGGYHPKIRDLIRSTKKLTNLLGDERKFGAGRIDDDLFREAYSWIPQSTVPRIVDKALVAAYREDIPFQFLLHVHDAMLIQAREPEIEAVSRRMVELMEIPLEAGGHTFTIPADAKIGHDWKNMEKLS